MTLSIESVEADRLAREVADLTGETVTQAVETALRERLAREQRRRGPRAGIAERLNELGRRCGALPDVDPRSPDEIIGYDEHGLPR